MAAAQRPPDGEDAAGPVRLFAADHDELMDLLGAEVADRGPTTSPRRAQLRPSRSWWSWPTVAASRTSSRLLGAGHPQRRPARPDRRHARRPTGAAADRARRPTWSSRPATTTGSAAAGHAQPSEAEALARIARADAHQRHASTWSTSHWIPTST